MSTPTKTTDVLTDRFKKLPVNTKRQMYHDLQQSGKRLDDLMRQNDLWLAQRNANK